MDATKPGWTGQVTDLTRLIIGLVGQAMDLVNLVFDDGHIFYLVGLVQVVFDLGRLIVGLVGLVEGLVGLVMALVGLVVDLSDMIGLVVDMVVDQVGLDHLLTAERLAGERSRDGGHDHQEQPQDD